VIDFLFYPRSIALIGALKDPQKVWYAVLNNIKKYNFTGEVFPINPKPEEILGHRAYQRIEDIKSAVDLAVIAIPARMVPQTLRDCIEKGVKSAVIISAGFKKTAERNKNYL